MELKAFMTFIGIKEKIRIIKTSFIGLCKTIAVAVKFRKAESSIKFITTFVERFLLRLGNDY